MKFQFFLIPKFTDLPVVCKNQRLHFSFFSRALIIALNPCVKFATYKPFFVADWRRETDAFPSIADSYN